MATASCEHCRGYGYRCSRCGDAWPPTNIDGKRRATCRCRAQIRNHRIRCRAHTESTRTCDFCNRTAPHDHTAEWSRLNIRKPTADCCPACHATILVAIDLMLDPTPELKERVQQKLVDELVDAANVVVRRPDWDTIAQLGNALEKMGQLQKGLYPAVSPGAPPLRLPNLWPPLRLPNLWAGSRGLEPSGSLYVNPNPEMAEAIRVGVAAIAQIQREQRGAPPPAPEGSGEADAQTWPDDVPHTEPES